MFVELSSPAQLQEKEQKLFAALARMQRVIVAFSGGTDSAYLAWAANRVLGANAIAITGTMTSSMSAVEPMMRLRCWTATSPAGFMTTMLQPASNPEAASSARPRSERRAKVP